MEISAAKEKQKQLLLGALVANNILPMSKDEVLKTIIVQKGNSN